MRLCLVGKFPPIQGGVSARMYRLAHGLARRGHAVHVVSNAMEVEDAYRVTMGREDQTRLARRYGDGYVRVHHTIADPQAQWHVPWHNPYTTKLAGLAIETILDHQLECVFSWYMEPYGVAGHLAASFTGTPHVMKTAGSDAGRLWHQPGMRTLYDHLLLAADVIMAGGSLPKALVELGVGPERIVPNDSLFVPLDEFAPEGDVLDFGEFTDPDRLREDVATIGVFGKLGRFKGTLSLLRAVRACLNLGTQVRLAAMVQGRPADERAFAELLRELDLQNHVIRVPFLPHWRVPEFLRACDVLCCLEQDFPIKAHAPLIAQEVLAAGRPALLSQEVAAKQPEGHRLAHGYNCWIIRDSTDHDEIARWLVHAIGDPSAVEVGARGRIFVEHVQSQCRFPAAYEKALQLAVGGLARVDSEREGTEGPGEHGLLDLLGLIRQEIAREAERCGMTLPEASTPGAEWFHAARSALAATRPSGSAAATEQVVRLALQLFEARQEDASPHGECLFRLHGDIPRWRVDDLVECTPSLTTGAIAQTYPSSPMDMVMGGDRDRGGPEVVVVILPFSTSQPVKVYVLSGPAAELVTACDGARTLSQLSHVLRWQDGDPLQNTLDLTEELFALGMLSVALPHDASRGVVMGAR